VWMRRVYGKKVGAQHPRRSVRLAWPTSAMRWGTGRQKPPVKGQLSRECFSSSIREMNFLTDETLYANQAVFLKTRKWESLVTRRIDGDMYVPVDAVDQNQMKMTHKIKHDQIYEMRGRPPRSREAAQVPPPLPRSASPGTPCARSSGSAARQTDKS
jgi:hypothetical protein